MISNIHSAAAVAAAVVLAIAPALASPEDPLPSNLATAFQPPAEFAGQYGEYRSLLKFADGTAVRNAEDWQRRRRELREQWMALMGPWPELIEKPRLEPEEKVPWENSTRLKAKLEVAPGLMLPVYLSVPEGPGPFPAVVVPYYDAETSVGLDPKKTLRDFALQLTRRGFVTLALGSPPTNAFTPKLGAEVKCQPLSFLAYIAANCYNALAVMPEVDPKRIGIVGHSYGGKWAMFGACLYEKFACGAWSDPGIVFDEKRGNVNYWEPWYLGAEPGVERKRGLVTPENPRTGAYKRIVEEGHDLHELHALMAPRPFLVSGGSEDFPARWVPLNHSIAVNDLLGFKNRVAMTNRPAHGPTEDSNAQIYAFFEWALKAPNPAKPEK